MSKSGDTMAFGLARKGSTDQAFDALADPTRREILAILAQVGSCNAGELADRITAVGRTAVSTHLRVLRMSGLVTSRREGKYLFYELDTAGSARDVIELVHSLFKGTLEDAVSSVERQSSAKLSGRRAERSGT